MCCSQCGSEGNSRVDMVGEAGPLWFVLLLESVFRHFCREGGTLGCTAFPVDV